MAKNRIRGARRALRAAAIAVLLLVPFTPARAAGEEAGTGAPVIIDFFFQAGCHECARIREEILPELKLRYEGFYELRERDIGVPEHYLLLARYQKQLDGSENAPVSMVLNEKHFLAGFDRIAEGLFPLMDRLVSEHAVGLPATASPAPRTAPRVSPPPDVPGSSAPAPATAPPVPTVPVQPAVDDAGKDLLRERVAQFTLAGVVVAGLVDGINPCAISTLVFFISLLSVLKVSGRRLVIVGASFVTASFITYTAIGFGLLRFLHLLRGYESVRTGINMAMVGFLAIFAVLSFLDAWRYHRTGKAGDVTLQLPEKIKLRIHRIMRGGLATHHLLLGSLFIGAAVTVLESVCTGQVYLPTLVMLIKGGGADLRSLLYLLLYNLLFQVPIVVVFVLTLQGLKTARLVSMSKRGVTISKVAMGLFFVFMAVLILLL